MSKLRKIMFVAGEASGDRHAARLIDSLRAAEPESEFDLFGAAGPAMRRAGVEAVVLADELSIVGLAEIGRAMPLFLRAINALKREASARKPDAAVLVDFPDFNLRLARSLKKKGIKVIYFISPQLWAWRQYRISVVRKYVDILLTILPFEAEWYRKRGVEHVEYVGNPLTHDVHPKTTREEFCSRNGLYADRPVIALLPGSRYKELVRILPEMLKAAALVSESIEDAQFVVALAAERHRSELETIHRGLISRDGQPHLRLTAVVGETYDVLNASDAAAVTSGTATLEAGIIGTPMAIVYKTSAINYALLAPMITVDHFGLVNLIAGERVARELIQHDFTPQSLAGELIRLLDPDENRSVRTRLQAAVEKLGEGGASKRAAEAVLRTIDESPVWAAMGP